MTFSQSSSGSSKCSLANIRRAWTCTGLSRGTHLALQDLSPWRRSVLLMVAFVTLVPALCRSFTRSPRVVLGFLLTVLVIILTPRGEILRGAPDRGRLSVVLYVFHFLIIAPTVDFFTPSCLPIADSVFPAWCRSTILFLVSFDSSLVLAIVEFGVWLFEVVDLIFYTDNEFKQMPLIQVTSGGQRSLLKKKLQVCESQQSCLFVGDQILIFHHNLQINSLKILQCDFLDFFSYFVSHSWGIPMMKITGLFHLFKWENLHNWWLTKYFFAPLYMYGRRWKNIILSYYKGFASFYVVCHDERPPASTMIFNSIWYWFVMVCMSTTRKPSVLRRRNES